MTTLSRSALFTLLPLACRTARRASSQRVCADSSGAASRMPRCSLRSRSVPPLTFAARRSCSMASGRRAPAMLRCRRPSAQPIRQRFPVARVRRHLQRGVRSRATSMRRVNASSTCQAGPTTSARRSTPRTGSVGSVPSRRRPRPAGGRRVSSNLPPLFQPLLQIPEQVEYRAAV